MTTAPSARATDWEAAAAALGAERVLVGRPAPRDWSLAAGRLEPRDQLYRRLLLESHGAPSGVVDTAQLGDVGLRLRAAGVGRVMVLAGPDPDSVVIVENPAGWVDAGRAGAAVADLVGPAGTAEPPGPLPAAAARGLERADLDLVARWVEAVSAHRTAGGLVSPAGAAALADAAGADQVVLLRPDGIEGDGVMASWGGAGGPGQGPVALAWPLPDDAGVVSEALDGLTDRPPVSPWQVVAAGRGPLAVAVTPPRPAVRGLGVVADFLAFDAERGRTTREGRQRSLLEERMRIAGLIHDGVTQQVSNVVIQLQLLELAAADPQRLGDTLRAAREATAAALEELRASLFELAPRLPDWDDLLTGLRAFAEDYAAQWGIGVEVRTVGEPGPLDGEVMMLAYSMVQECLTNVRKHAEADSALVTVSFSGDRLGLSVADDGSGFPDEPDEPGPAGRRMGLRLLRDRIRSAGGRLEVTSRPGEGAEVSVVIPL